MITFDTHAHLFWSNFDSDRDEVIERATGAGVAAILNLGTTVDTSRTCISLAERHDRCWAAVGFHPHDVGAFSYDRDEALTQLRILAEHPKVVAVGETGLDFYRGRKNEQLQRDSLRVHLDLARAADLPVVLHNRAAGSELRAILEEYGPEITAILHCFVGDEEFGHWAIDRGHYLGLGGIFTFPSSGLPEMVKAWNLDHLVLETDSPFLSPAPHRGKRNEPSFIVHTAVAIADALGMAAEELAARTTANACRVLDIPLPGGGLVSTREE